ncbi:hypothetical protein BJF82_10110 [Kytococcus sp. CUA-901]|nr:hypothetical protein BJF82_10110 [Kytococcus sp. CUA-901]
MDDVLDEVLALVDRDASDTSVLEAAMTSPAVSAIALRRGTTWVLVGPVDGAPRSTAGARRFSVHPGGPLRAHTWRDHRGARVEPVPVSPPPTGSLSGEPSA